jgi:hypothetical protein
MTSTRLIMEKAQSTIFDYPHFTQFPKESEMFRPELYVGVDIGSKTFTASIGKFEEKEGWRISAKPITLTFGKPLTNSIKRY